MMVILKYMLYGLVSGFTEFLPVSARAHQSVLMYLFGMEARSPLLDLAVHIGVLSGLLMGIKSLLSKLQRERLFLRHRRKSSVFREGYDLRIVKTASVPMTVMLLCYCFTYKLEQNIPVLSLFLLANGALMLLTGHLRQGNKDSRGISALDALCFGAGSGLSAFPGLSRIGCGMSVSSAIGSDRQSAYSWVLLLSIPALGLYLCYDLLTMILAGVGAVSIQIIAGWILACLAAIAGGYFSIYFMRQWLVNSNLTGFAYYSMGTAAFTFILYLIT